MRSDQFIALAWSCLFPLTVFAHPHVRVVYQVDPVFEQGSIRAMHINWQLDAMTSAQIRENIDLNKNGVLDESELQAFADSNFELMKPNEFFLTLQRAQDATPVAFEVVNYNANDAGHGFQGGIHMTFTVQIKDESAHSGLKVKFFDPTWYMALLPQAGFGSTSLKNACHAEILNATSNTALQGQQVVPLMWIQCAKENEVRPTAQTFLDTEPIHGDSL